MVFGIPFRPFIETFSISASSAPIVFVLYVKFCFFSLHGAYSIKWFDDTIVECYPLSE